MPAPTPDPNEQTMLIAFDGSAESRRAFAYAAALLRPAQVQILTAWEPLHRQAARAAGGAGMMQHDFSAAVDTAEGDPAYTRALEISQEGVALAESLGFHAHALLVECSTAIWSALVDAAQELKPDVVVTGTKGYRGIKSFFKSSTAENLLHNVGMPIFIVPPLDDDEDTD
ncbi:universal stress protein UspA-like protein [Corynebacterium epidermidicanis]|uniref:Universal stress protein UspA-like protein n=2 Tax=Corynebacterium epidermidicanis TaxID=1050174 RepID=A0A0G3GZ97_9CORY|nr:universal stress protein UspA-like protein [Corynebacterium epidermidicanis]